MRVKRAISILSDHRARQRQPEQQSGPHRAGPRGGRQHPPAPDDAGRGQSADSHQ